MILAIIFLLSSLLLALAIAKKFDSQNQLAYAIPLSIIASAFFLAASSLAMGFGTSSVALASIAMLTAFWLLEKNFDAAKLLQKRLLPLAIFSLLFFAWMNALMFHYDARGGVEGFSTDFGFHKSIIASIANGNFPTEHPLFAGQPLSYYYFQHLYSAGLVAGGTDLATASAIANVLANVAVVLLLFILAERIVPAKAKGLNGLFPYLAIALVLLNGNLSFFQFLQNGFDASAITQFSEFTDLKLTPFPVLNLLSAHLLVTTYAMGLAVLLIAAIKILDKDFRKTIIVGLLPLLSLPAFIAGILMLAFYAIKESKARKPFALALLLAAPQLAFYALTHAGPAIYFNLGWLSPAQDFVSIAVFWLQNLGLYAVLGAAGYAFAKDDVKKLLQSTLAPFIAGNIFIFTPFAWDTGKLFLFFFAILAVLSAIALNRIAEKRKALVLVLAATMVLTGLFSIATVIANSSTPIYDSFDMRACEWVEKNTPPNALFLTDGQHTCVFAIAGRRVFLGDTEWMETHGLDYAKQLEENNAMLAGDCALVKKRGIGYAYLDGYGGRHAFVNETFLRENAIVVYAENNRVVFKTDC